MEDNAPHEELFGRSMIPILFEHRALMTSFASAIARSHPNPKALLAAFEQQLAQDKAQEIPFTDLTPENQVARDAVYVTEHMLVSILQARAQESST